MPLQGTAIRFRGGAPRAGWAARRAMFSVTAVGLCLGVMGMADVFKREAEPAPPPKGSPFLQMRMPEGAVACTTEGLADGLVPVACDRAGGTEMNSDWVGWLPEETRALLPKWCPDQPVVFVGGRRTPGGPERLVCVFAQCVECPNPAPGEEGGLVLRLRTRVFERTYHAGDRLGMITETPPYLARAGCRADGLLAPASGPGGRATLTVYVGQADPADRSRVVVDYECNGKEGTVAGTLGADDLMEWHVERGTMRVVGTR